MRGAMLISALALDKQCPGTVPSVAHLGRRLGLTWGTQVFWGLFKNTLAPVPNRREGEAALLTSSLTFTPTPV